MSADILTLNAGSSSLKFSLFRDRADAGLDLVLSGGVERIGDRPAIKAKRADGLPIDTADLPPQASSGDDGALRQVLDLIGRAAPGVTIEVIGHRVVHGGIAFETPVIVEQQVLDALAQLEPFAPLHQPHNLTGIRSAGEAFPGALQVACFDTSFHRNHPWVNDVFALPMEYYDKGVRRYGFHGLSYEYISGYLKETAPLLHAGRVVVAHLGNGSSMCAILNGRSVGSTMGFSALDGLPMGTRSGQLDPGVLLYLMQEGMGHHEISDLLYTRSGLLGLSGLSNDMRTLEASGDARAARAIDYYVFRVRRELGALAAVLGGLDAVVFTGGIGEHSARVRRSVCEGLGWLGIEIDAHENDQHARVISTDLSRVRVLVIPTNEELVIARAASALARARPTKDTGR
jgi:acetate kinase